MCENCVGTGDEKRVYAFVSCTAVSAARPRAPAAAAARRATWDRLRRMMVSNAVSQLPLAAAVQARGGQSVPNVAAG